LAFTKHTKHTNIQEEARTSEMSNEVVSATMCIGNGPSFWKSTKNVSNTVVVIGSDAQHSGIGGLQIPGRVAELAGWTPQILHVCASDIEISNIG
jgi:hypothetical protein